MSRAFRWLSVCAWACLLLLTIYDSVRLPRHFVVEGVDVVPELVRRQEIDYLCIAAGLVLALIGLRFNRWWTLPTIVSSLTYLVRWYTNGPLALVGPADGYRLMWQTATRFGLYISFIIRDLLVPGALAVSLAGALWYPWRQKSIGTTVAR